MKLREDPSAVGQTVAFLMASGILMASVGAVLVATEGIGSEARTQAGTQASLEADAQNLLKILLGSPGYIGDGSPDWIPFGPQADDLTRLGLRNPTDQALGFDKLRNLRLAPFEADDSDGLVNYEEAIAALGLDEKGLDFHIRAKPALRSVEELLSGPFGKDSNLRVTYIGDAERSSGTVPLAQGLDIGKPTCALSDISDEAIRIAVSIGNGGTTTTQFSGTLDVRFGSADRFQGVAYGGLVAKDTTSTLHLDIPATSGRDCDTITSLGLEVRDPISRILSKAWNAAELASLEFDSASPNLATRTMTVEPATNAFLSSGLDSGSGVFVVYDGDIKRAQGGNPADRLILTVTKPNGEAPYTEEFPVPHQQKDREYEVPAAALDVGINTVTLQLKGTNLVVSNQIVVVDEELDPYTPVGGGDFSYKWSESARVEATMINGLMDRFCATDFGIKDAWLTEGQSWDARCGDYHEEVKESLRFRNKDVDPQFGDVFPDLNDVMNSDLPARLIDDETGDPRYDLVNVLVVGSNVDHSAMTSAHAKHSVRDWVLGGGTLIVLGSKNQAVQWLQPIFHSGIQSSSTGLNTPDIGHPMLNVPNQLPHDAYEHGGRVWAFQGNGPNAPDQYFTQVVQDDNNHPVMAVSDSGAYGDGTVILTTYMAHDLFGDGSDANRESGMALLHNLIIQGGYRDLFLDYGPPLPRGYAVVPALGFAEVWHPELEMMVTLEVTLFVFPNVR